MALAGAVLGAAAETKTLQAQSATGYTDFDIVNFALNLEYLEAEFYTVATTGAYIDSLGIPITGAVGTAGATSGGNLVTFTDPQVAAIALELANDERQHVILLQEAVTSLGGQYIAKPAINLNALGIGFGSQAEFLTLARAFEDIGITAYAGGATLIVNPAVLGYAARILAVEALHSGSIRNAVDRLGVAVSALDPADIIPPPAGT
ncbi:ferritin-like domain-containing protein, partial [Nevskia soli]|uniref:ferritin-like domain-containing protein n=1 Tax=Nevskia soli TaxID=418856 RepID=UPI0015D7130E